MKFAFASSGKVIDAASFSEFNVIQDNRSKKVTIIKYDSRIGTREMIFLNGIEAILNARGRYVQAKSNREDCAYILKDEDQLPVISNEEAIKLIEENRKNGS